MSLSPKEAMAMGMAYFQRKATQILETIEKSRAEGIPISEFGQEMQLVKQYQEAMIECAAKLAPFVHPKLAAVEVRTEQVQPFVIRVPVIESDAERWAESSQKVIDVEPTK